MSLFYYDLICYYSGLQNSATFNTLDPSHLFTSHHVSNGTGVGQDIRNIRPGALVASDYPGEYYYHRSSAGPQPPTSASMTLATAVGGNRRQPLHGGGPSAENFFRPVSPNAHIYMEIDPTYGKMDQRRMDIR